MIWRSVMIFFITVTIARAFEGETTTPDTTFKRKIIDAVRITNPIVLDGKLTEGEWQRPPITGFTQLDPNEGQPASESTHVWVAYDDEAIYVAARLYDSPDSIVSRLGRRDMSMDADLFYFGIDAYHDKQTGFFFGVYPSGSIIDGTLYNDSWNDNTWDGVWQAATTIDDKGWTVEMKIPYSQLRFPKQDEYVWGVNFGRQIIRKQEQSWFVMVPKKESGWVSRFAELHGIKDIDPPTRIEVLPYVVSSIKATNQFNPGDPFHKTTMFDKNLGADLKLGLGSNLTLNATINPDFGQVEVDPAVVNLSQFETFFQEKRPFFIEGSNMFDFGYGGANNNWGFNWGSPQFFYSRRIGRQPSDPGQHSGYTDLPSNTTILGAGKITGKIGDNFSLGSLFAATQREYEQVQDSSGNRYSDVAEPYTTYGVVRGLNTFNQGRQGLGFLGTAVLRDLNRPYLQSSFNKNAYSFGADGWTNIDSAAVWVINGWASTSRVEGTRDQITALQVSPLHYYQQHEIKSIHVDSNATHLTGYATRIALNKQNGNFFLNSALGIISPGFETNDLGYLFRTNQINWHTVVGYSWYVPDSLFRQKYIQAATFQNYDFGGNKFGQGYFLFYGGTLWNYWSVYGNALMNTAVFDRTSTRGGPYMKTTNSYDTYINIGTDSRENVIAYLYLEGERAESGGYYYSYSPSLQLKLLPNLSINLSPGFTRNVTDAQYVTTVEDPTATNTGSNRYVFGRLNQYTFSSDIRVDWTFTPKLSLQVYVQPLISVGLYDHFKELKTPRTYTFNQYGTDNGSTIAYADSDRTYYVNPEGNHAAPEFNFSNPNFNFKSLRGNVVLRWEYLPGSTLYLVWTREGTRSDNPDSYSFGRDFGNLVTAPDHEDNFLLKIAYWITP